MPIPLSDHLHPNAIKYEVSPNVFFFLDGEMQLLNLSNKLYLNRGFFSGNIPSPVDDTCIMCPVVGTLLIGDVACPVLEPGRLYFGALKRGKKVSSHLFSGGSLICIYGAANQIFQ